jgi:hypothetical protein
MDAQTTATRKDIDDVLGVLDVMMTRIDERFSQSETTLSSAQKQIQNILIQLDHIEKRLEISEDERLVMAPSAYVAAPMGRKGCCTH